MKAGDPRRGGTRLDIRPDGSGYALLLDGLNIANTVQTLELDADGPEFTMTLGLRDLVVAVENVDVSVRLRPDTVAALEALGWTPPAGDEQVTP